MDNEMTSQQEFIFTNTEYEFWNPSPWLDGPAFYSPGVTLSLHV